MRSFIIAILTCSVSMSVLALLYMALTPFLAKRYSEKSRYYAWFIIIVGLLFPLRPQFGNALIKIDVPGEIAAPIIQIGSDLPIVLSAHTGNTEPSVVPLTFSVWQIWTAIWLAGLIVFLAYHAIKHYRFVKMVTRWSMEITDEQTLAMLHVLKTDMGIHNKTGLYLCLSIGSPLMFGLVSPRILLPKMDLEHEELRLILTHELIHYKRKDLCYKCATLIAVAIHWFNPIVYRVARAIETQCETSCDAEVVRSKCADTRRRYSKTIVRVASNHSMHVTALSTNLYGGKKNMKNRISSIMDMGNKKAGIIIVCCVLAATLGTGAVFAAATDGKPPIVSSKTENLQTKTNTAGIDIDGLSDEQLLTTLRSLKQNELSKNDNRKEDSLNMSPGEIKNFLMEIETDILFPMASELGVTEDDIDAALKSVGVKVILENANMLDTFKRAVTEKCQTKFSTEQYEAVLNTILGRMLVEGVYAEAANSNLAKPLVDNPGK